MMNVWDLILATVDEFGTNASGDQMCNYASWKWRHMLTKFATNKVTPVMVSTRGSVVPGNVYWHLLTLLLIKNFVIDFHIVYFQLFWQSVNTSMVDQNCEMLQIVQKYIMVGVKLVSRPTIWSFIYNWISLLIIYISNPDLREI